MKQRVVSAMIIVILFIPFLLVGGQLFNLGVLIVSNLALQEFIKIKDEKKHIPSFIKFISYIMITLLILTNVQLKELTFAIDYRVLAALFITYLLPTVLYHDHEKYSINDAFYLIGGVLFLGISMSLFVLIREKSLALMIYLILVAVITDTYAYIVGCLIGKHKMLEVISPKKTWEGMIGGTVFGVLFGTVVFHLFVSKTLPIYAVVIITLFLSLLGQFGDLVFSNIKRYFGKKDFSNLIAGHGGILDRLDSIIFVLLGFMFFMILI